MWWSFHNKDGMIDVSRGLYVPPYRDTFGHSSRSHDHLGWSHNNNGLFLYRFVRYFNRTSYSCTHQSVRYKWYADVGTWVYYLKPAGLRLLRVNFAIFLRQIFSVDLGCLKKRNFEYRYKKYMEHMIWYKVSLSRKKSCLNFFLYYLVKKLSLEPSVEYSSIEAPFFSNKTFMILHHSL